MQKLVAQTESWYLHSSEVLNNSSHREEMVYLSRFILIVIVQAAYFYFYDKFPFTDSILWSLLDWGIWFPMFLLVFHPEKVFGLPERFGLGKAGLFIVITLTFPPIHALICFYIYTFFVPVEGEFFVNLGELIARRWFHNMLLTAVFVFVFDHIKQKLQIDPNSDSEKPRKPIILKDGVQLHQLQPEEIHWISVAKNYVIITTAEKQLLIRMTLNDIFEKVKEYGFVRISRSIIVNKVLIKEIKKQSRYSQSAKLNTGTDFPIGRTYLKSVVQSIAS